MAVDHEKLPGGTGIPEVPDSELDFSASRRSFFAWATGFIGAFIGLILSIPLLGYVISPAFRRQSRDWIQVGSVADLRNNHPKQLSFATTQQDGWMRAASVKNIWAVRLENEEVLAFSPLCTHLGCGYNWIQDQKGFVCPCHASLFDLDGKVLKGPAPRPLDRLPTKIENGRLYVIYKDFKSGTAKKIEI